MLGLQTRHGQELRCEGAPRETVSPVVHYVNGVPCSFVLKDVTRRTGSADATRVWSGRCQSLSLPVLTGEIRPSGEGGEEVTLTYWAVQTLPMALWELQRGLQTSLGLVVL